MDKATTARNQLVPLLDHLIRELDAEGCATQRAYFARIRSHLDDASDDMSLQDSIIELGSSNAIGFQLSSTASALVDRILQKTAVLITELEGQPPAIH